MPQRPSIQKIWTRILKLKWVINLYLAYWDFTYFWTILRPSDSSLWSWIGKNYTVQDLDPRRMTKIQWYRVRTLARYIHAERTYEVRIILNLSNTFTCVNFHHKLLTHIPRLPSTAATLSIMYQIIFASIFIFNSSRFHSTSQNTPI